MLACENQVTCDKNTGELKRVAATRTHRSAKGSGQGIPFSLVLVHKVCVVGRMAAIRLLGREAHKPSMRFEQLQEVAL